jgi:hypothetical protein
MTDLLSVVVMLCLGLGAVVCPAVAEPLPGPKVFAAGGAAQVSERWQPATYLGLTVGRSTAADMYRKLGKPKSEGKAELDTRSDKIATFRHEYASTGVLAGKLLIFTTGKSGRITDIEIYPTSLPLNELTKQFGSQFKTTRYDFDNCLNDGESGPIYESKNGSISYVEYRQLGIAVRVGPNSLVEEILFVSEPVGSKFSVCKRRRVHHK